VTPTEQQRAAIESTASRPDRRECGRSFEEMAGSASSDMLRRNTFEPSGEAGTTSPRNSRIAGGAVQLVASCSAVSPSGCMQYGEQLASVVTADLAASSRATGRSREETQCPARLP